MGRTAKQRQAPPGVRPVEKVELSQRHVPLRMLLFILCVIVAAVALGIAVSSAFSGDSGWREIRVEGSAPSCAGEFIFQYHLGSSGVAVPAENRALTKLYTDLMQEAYRAFDVLEEDGIHNLCYLNAHPNEAVELEPVLADALARAEAMGLRTLYLGPVAEAYENIFYAQDERQTVDFDPFRSEEAAREYAEIAAFARDPQAIRLEIEGNTAKLVIAPEYLAYGQENGITRWLDFSWLRNAFVIDRVADRLMAEGYTRGSLSSYDGYVRNLDASPEHTYAFNLFARDGMTVYPAATWQYTGPMSLVCLRNYPQTELDVQHYYERKDGFILTAYLDPADGLCRSGFPNAVAYSPDLSCAELAAGLFPAYLSGETADLAPLLERGAEVILCNDYTVRHTQAEIRLTDLYQKNGVTYTEEVLKP